jgi:hypothetical protein
VKLTPPKDGEYASWEVSLANRRIVQVKENFRFLVLYLASAPRPR